MRNWLGFQIVWDWRPEFWGLGLSGAYPKEGPLKGAIYSWVLRLGPLDIRRWGYGGCPYDDDSAWGEES